MSILRLDSNVLIQPPFYSPGEQKDREWLETDGLGGFSMGTFSGHRSRRYHGLLISARRPPSDRMMLVNGFEAWISGPKGFAKLTEQTYAGAITTPREGIESHTFSPEPWPTWTYRLWDSSELRFELWRIQGTPSVHLRWELLNGDRNKFLQVRLLFSGRDFHALHRENSAFQESPQTISGGWRWEPYPSVPAIFVITKGEYQHQPTWYRQFEYTEELARGLDGIEDLASPGIFRWDLKSDPATMTLTSSENASEATEDDRDREAKRRTQTPLERTVNDYLVRRGKGWTIIAGYPWFGDWGRDTFIAMRGLCLATGRWEIARDILLEWSQVVRDGLLPNRFSDDGSAPEYNSVDAALLYIVVVGEFLEAHASKISLGETEALYRAVETILSGYANGTRFGIRMDTDGLIAAGEPGLQLTWMDAKVGNWVVTPRIGKPVEIQALWLHALLVGAKRNHHWETLYTHALESFQLRFWTGNQLHDLVDVNHQHGEMDSTFRPNQIFAVGGLPRMLLPLEQARTIVDRVEAELLTPIGLRSLSPHDSAYQGYYQGGIHERDGAYHQGTVWPWLIGPFIEAWLRVRGNTIEAKREASERFLKPLEEHRQQAGWGHLSEIADGNSPHHPRGCPFQAWSVGEWIRIKKICEP